MAAVPFFRDTKMATMTSRENTLDATEFACVACAYAYAYAYACADSETHA